MCSNVWSLPMPSSSHSHYELKSCVLFHAFPAKSWLKQWQWKGWWPVPNSNLVEWTNLRHIAAIIWHLTHRSSNRKKWEKKTWFWSGPASLQSRLSHSWLSYFLAEKTCTVGPTLRHLPNPRRCQGHSGERKKRLKHGPTQKWNPIRIYGHSDSMW